MNKFKINIWDIKDIKYTISDKFSFYSLYTIYDDLKCLPKKYYLKFGDTKDIFKVISNIKFNSDIMISYIQNYQVFLLILDQIILIFKEENLYLYQNFLKENSDSLLYYTIQTEERIQIFINNISSYPTKIDQQSKIININDEMEDKITQCILKKSKYRTLLRHFDIRQKENENYSFKYNDFISIKNFQSGNNLVFNKKDQFLYVLKSFLKINDKEYNHEMKFYEKVDRTAFIFIRKKYGQFKQGDVKYIVFEYIEGETLNRFILNHRNNIHHGTKIVSIIQILFSVHFIHSNFIFLRDLKWDNIIINYFEMAILFDFDNSKEFGSNATSNDEEHTSCIGNSFFTAPEQLETCNYTYKVDIYSIGMIIYFIITEDFELQRNIFDIEKSIKFPIVFDYILPILKQCLKTSANERPEIGDIINHIIFNANDSLRFLIKNFLSNFILILETVILYEKDQSYLSYFLGEVYFNELYTQCNIKKSIYYLEMSSRLNNPNAQYLLGQIYQDGDYVPRDMNKSIYYLTLSSNQNHSKAQYLLGQIYLNGTHVPKDINKSIYYLTLSSDQNNPHAQFLLAHEYLKGKNVPQNFDKGIHYMELSANQNNSNALAVLGNIYYKGKIALLDINKAIHYLERSANLNNHLAQFLLGKIYLGGKYIQKNITKSIFYLTLSANQNNSKAQLYLGLIYLDNAQNDINKSIHYFTLSSNQNNSRAQYILGYLYLKGIFISKDINKSMYYLTLSSDQNNPHAQFQLGKIYYKGKYVPKDKTKAIQFLTLAINQNDFEAQYYLGKIYLNDKKSSENIKKAIHYLTLSSNQNYSKAQFLLGIIYYLEIYSSQDIYKAIHYFTLVSKKNISNATYYLGEIYYLSNLIPHDIQKSIYYLSLALNQNHSQAAFLLGHIYYTGKLIPQDITKSIYYLTISMNQNNLWAQYLLGYIYYEGKYVKQDINKSIYLLTLSSNQGSYYAHFLLGSIYFEGKYVEIDINKAIYHFKHAADHSIDFAQLNLGKIYYTNEFVPRDIKQSIHYFKESSCFNNCYAKNFLGIIYKNGDGVEKNISGAIEYFEEAIRQKNDVFAMHNISRIYYFDYNNITKAIEYLEMASKNNYKSSFFAELFLFFIYSHGEEKIKNENKSFHYLDLIINSYDFPSRDFLYKCFINVSSNEIYYKRLEKFLKEYDLIHLHSLTQIHSEFIYFMKEGRFYVYKKENENQNKSSIANINAYFYQGIDLN